MLVAAGLGGLVGEFSEAEALVNNISVRCLLDTGSPVSTVSQK